MNLYLARFIYWADQGQTPAIQRAWLDGTHKQVVVHDEVKEPTDLIIDPNSHYLYWTDAGMDGIYRINPELLLNSADTELKPELVRADIAEATGIAIVGQNMYWTDRRLEKVFAGSSKPNQSAMILSPVTVVGDLQDLTDLAAFDALAQPKSTSPCHIRTKASGRVAADWEKKSDTDFGSDYPKFLGSDFGLGKTPDFG
uniref:Low-density lipoprotein receptor-related protein 6 n=1 Tax=Globodera pallida TaxID=36090 RepID=A0A183BI71_GLOPA